IRELLELLVLGHEIGFAVELDQHAALTGDEPLGRGTLGTLAHILGALDAQEFDGLVEVAGVFFERLLAIHHPGAGELPEPLDIGGGVVRHRGDPPWESWPGPRAVVVWNYCWASAWGALSVAVPVASPAAAAFAVSADSSDSDRPPSAESPPASRSCSHSGNGSDGCDSALSPPALRSARFCTP